MYSGVNAPVGSTRLANIRDGLDDYDYAALLREHNATLARELARTVSGGEIGGLVRNATVLLQARLKMGSALELLLDRRRPVVSAS